MATEQLKHTLRELHEALASGAPLDPEMVQLLKILDADIQTTLSRQSLGSASAETPATAPEDDGLTSRAQEISAKFAAQHPHLEPVLRELTDTLQRIGI